MADVEIKQLLKDKRVWAGAAVVAAIAVVAVIRNRATPGDAAPVGSGANPVGGTAGYYQALGDTSGANLASFLGNWGQANLDAQRMGFESILDALKKGSDTVATTTATYAGGQHLQAWLNEINAANPGLNLTTAKFRELNPGVNLRQADSFGFLGSGGQRGGTVVDVFGDSGTVRIR